MIHTVVVVVVVVLTLVHLYNAVRGHRTGSNNSGAEIIAGGKQIKTQDNTQNLKQVVNLRQKRYNSCR